MSILLHFIFTGFFKVLSTFACVSCSKEDKSDKRGRPYWTLFNIQKTILDIVSLCLQSSMSPHQMFKQKSWPSFDVINSVNNV